MSSQILERNSGANREFPADRRLVIEEVVDEAAERGEQGFRDEEEEDRSVFSVEEGDMVQGVEIERGEKRGKGRGRKTITGLVFLVVFVGGAGLAGWFLVGNGATRKARVPVNGSNGTANSVVQAEEAMTLEAIKQAGLTGPGMSGPGITMSDGSVVRPGLQPINGTVPASLPESSVPVTQMAPINGGLSSTVKSVDSNTGNDSSGAGEVKPAVASVASAVLGRNGERSVMIGSDVKPVIEQGGVRRLSNSNEDRKDGSGIALPSFGTMLPVKSLGVLFTLRSGGLVRLELTRDVKGKGWSMPRGTVLVGALRGAEFDRAFVSLVGFIDSESGKFVKVSGDLLGSDGGSGIRGKRKKMSSNWSRVLAGLGEAGLRAVGTLAGSFGRGPIVITDAFSGSGGRVTNELGGLLGGDRNTFVEVAAGSPGYVMITELPESVQGVDALAKLSGRDLEEKSDVERPRRSTGISERELTELIQSGDPERIKAALPRMSPEMRRVAELVVSGDLAGEE